MPTATVANSSAAATAAAANTTSAAAATSARAQGSDVSCIGCGLFEFWHQGLPYAN